MLAAAAAFSFGAIVSFATAGHYHVNCNNHGLVHGGSTADSAYHARVESAPCWYPSRCDVGQWNNIIRYGTAGRGVTCDTFIYAGPECAGLARVELGDVGVVVFNYHGHKAHSPC